MNLIYDADSPESVAHFYPTAKTAPLINVILGNAPDRSTFVFAPYGSGKSLTATFALHLIENTPAVKAVLLPIVGNFQKLDNILFEFSEQRIQKEESPHGIVIAIHGNAHNLAETIKSATLESLQRTGMLKKAKSIRETECTSSDEIAPFLRTVLKFSTKHNLDRVAILWDEFGKHLELLIAEGRAAELIAVQQLSEYVSRSKTIPITLTLFMHQGLMRYAANLPTSARMEWAKIAGRFRTLQYVDTSKEIYQLIATIVIKLRDISPSKKPTQAQARDLLKHHLFKDFSAKELQALIQSAHPIEPVALHLLPRISSRVAQNERTLFNFLYEQNLGELITSDVVYDYFSNEMHTDSSVGGTSKQWLQTESAIAKCAGDELAVKVLKCACLLGMGLTGERAQVSKGLLTKAAAGFGSETAPNKTIKELIRKNLLLYRRHTDSVSVWHGTDYDLRGKVEERKSLLRSSFDFIHFLQREAPPRPWTPIRYNVDFHIKRYFPGVYASLEQLQDEEFKSLEKDGHLFDGKIIYCMLRDNNESRQAQKIAKKIAENRLVLIVPNEHAPVFDAALEVKALLDLSIDYQFISQDPLLPVELNQMLDDSRAYLQRMLDRLTTPFGSSSVYKGGHKINVNTEAKFREQLSRIMEDEFNCTPKIRNELLVRHRISRPMQNARKKLVFGILEQAEKAPTFGFTESEIKTPQASMFRSVLRNTGLYNSEKLLFASPSQIADVGLREVWKILKEFFAEPGEKKVEELIIRLQRKPYGVRMGLMPVLFAAGYKAFAESVVLKREGEYLNDIGSSTIEQVCSCPNEFSLVVLKITPKKQQYLENLSDLFAFGEIQDDSDTKPQRDLVRRCYEALIGWKSELPIAALRTNAVTDAAAAFQQAMLRLGSPDDFFFVELPASLGCTKSNYDGIIKATKRVIDELTNVISIYQRDVEVLIRQIFDIENKGTKTSLADIAKSWVELFPEEIRTGEFNFVAKRLCDVILNHQDSNERLLDSIALILVGKGLIHWDDTTNGRFKDLLHEQTARMLRQALESQEMKKYQKSADKLVVSQIRILLDRYERSFGQKEAASIMSTILESNHGNNR